MNKILYATSEECEDNKAWVFNYYITKDYHIGIMITSSSENKHYENSVSGIFPCRQDAEKLLKFLYDNHASPISMPYLISEFIENNFLHDAVEAIDLNAD